MKLSILAALFVSLPVRAAEHPEHPKEHPTHHHEEGVKHDHAAEKPMAPKALPDGRQDVSAPAATPAAPSRSEIETLYSGIVTDHVKADAKAHGGAFLVKDEATGKDRRLGLVRIHKDRIVKLSETEAFACSDFKTVKGGKDKLDLDFYVAKEGEGWKISKVLIHKVNGKPRYNYNDKNEMVPLKP